MNAGTEEPTLGAMIAGMLVLGTLGCSLLMIAFWIMRYLQFGYVLPDSRRGYLRVPLAGTIVGIIVATFLAILATLLPLLHSDQFAAAAQGNPPGTPAPGETTPAETTPTETAAEPDQAPESSDQPATAERKLTPDMMWAPILQTLIMDLILFGGFGLLVYAFSFQSRVRGPTQLFPEVAGEAAASATATAEVSATGGTSTRPMDQERRIASLWPDLEDNTTPPVPSSVPVGNLVPSDPFTEMVPQVERFSFWREVRFAGEVFLASYLPTTVLRFVIIFLISVITGELPDQHPFLEMMKEGIDLSLLAMIFLMAVILAPIVEELFYRIVILGGLCQQGNVWIGMFVSCLLFSFAHGFPDSLALLPLAAALGYTYVRRQSYVTVMLIHFFFNAFNMIIATVGLM